MSLLLCWLDYDKSFCYAGLPSSTFKWVKGLHDGIFLAVSLIVAIMKDQVAILEEQMVDISPFAWPDCHGAALNLLIILLSHNMSKRCITDYVPAGQQLNTKLTTPFPPRAGVDWLVRIILCIINKTSSWNYNSSSIRETLCIVHVYNTPLPHPQDGTNQISCENMPYIMDTSHDLGQNNLYSNFDTYCSVSNTYMWEL